MNILVFSWRDPKHPLAGGAEQVMHEHMKGWKDKGHTVTLFSSGAKNVEKEETFDGIRIVRRGSQYLTVQISAFFWYLFFSGQKFDIVVDQFHGLPFFTPLYVRAPKMAVIQELTREVWFRYPLPYGLSYIFGTLGYLVEPLFFLLYRNVHFMTGSQSAKEELQTVGIKKENITIVPHGVILALPKKRYKKEKMATIIFLGALASDKGIEDAIVAFSLLDKVMDCQFWVVGKGDEKYLECLKNQANEQGISRKVTFFGFVSQEKKFELLSRAHVMVNPSIREGWGLVNIEANAAGTPVVAYNSPGLVDSVKDGQTGIICKKNTPSNLSKEVLRLINNKNEYQKFQKRAREWSGQFSWVKSKQKSLQLIEDILEEE